MNNQDSILTENKNGYLKLPHKEISNANDFCEGYKDFLNKCKTERESVKYITDKIKSHGFEVFNPKKKYNPGDKIYYINRNKSIIIATIGSTPLSAGTTMVISHIDSPRIDLTPRPLYEENELAFFKTQYYGGIKKYQWTSLPLAIHGVIIKKDGTSIEITLGETENEPVFCITDLLPHLAENQFKRPSPQIVKGDELNILIGSYPNNDDDNAKTSPVKFNIMKLLNKKYGIIEQDFVSADLSFVPAFKARDIGFDSSMIGAYGQDDRVCAYASLEAHLKSHTPKQTTITVFTDKEETGSNGNTGLKSRFLEYFVSYLSSTFGEDVKEVLSNSICLSADVTSGFDPTWKEPYEIHNSAYLNYGVALTKYNGGRGKSGTSEASPELLAQVINVLDENNIIWQTGGLGKVDVGGGGTIANYVANLDVEVLDIGVPVLSMHAPYEVVSKIDVYMTHKAFYHFINR